MLKRVKGIARLTALVAVVSLIGCAFNTTNSTPKNRTSCGGTANGYFDIYYPASDQSLKMGTIDSIIWTNLVSPLPSIVSLSLFKGQDFVRTITAGTNNVGIYHWTVPNSGTGSDYRIRVRSTADTTNFDFSCNFRLYSQYSGSFTISNPTASSACTTGNTIEIQWQATGTPGNYVTLQLCEDTAAIRYITTQTTTVSGAFDWLIPANLMKMNNYRIKISSYYDPAIFAYSDLFTIEGITPDSFEPDNKRDSASTLSPLGKPQTHNLTVNDTDWVSFSLDSGNTYLLQSYGAVSTLVYLYYGSETSYSTAFTSSLSWLCLKSGVWYARISAYSSSAMPATYTFNVCEYDSLMLATISSPGSNTTWATGSTYQIQWLPDTAILGTYVTIYLYMGSQQLLYLTSSTSNSGVYNWYIPTGLASGSDYRIKIVNYNNTAMGGFSPAFTISGLSPDAYEPDNIREKAGTYSPIGKPQTHSLTMNDTDWVQFTADSNTNYLLQSYGNIATRVYLYYGNEVTLSASFYTSSSTGTASLTWLCPKGGIWYARIAPYSSSTYGGTYSFNVIKYDSLTVTFASPSQNSTWAAGSSYEIQWIPDSSVLGTYVNIYLFKGSQQLSYIASSVSNRGYYTWTVPAGLGTGSDYCLKITNYSTGIGGFSPNFTISGLAPDEYEPDDQRDMASTLSPLGKAQSHNLTMNDTDWVKFTPDSGTTYFLQSSGTIATRVYLFYGTDASYYTYFSTSSSSSPASLTWKCPKAGVWYARIAPYSSSTYGGTYLFNVIACDSFMVTFSSPAEGATWAAGSSYQIQWVPDSSILGTSVRIYLYKGTQQLIYITSSASNRGYYSWTVPSGLGTGSDYCLKITNYSTDMGGFSPYFTISGLTPDAYEPDDQRDKAAAFSPLGKAQSHNLTMNDTDWVKFTPDSGRTYLLQSSGTIATRVYLFYGTDASYSTYFYTSSTSSPASLTWKCPKAGIWYARIAAYSSSSYGGTYSFIIAAYDSLAMVSFTSPTSSSVWTSGSSYRIQWAPDSAVLGTYVYIYLYKGDRYIQYVYSSSRTNNGYYDWTVPAGLATGSDYRIKIVNYNNTILGGFSPAFSISGFSADAYEPDDSVSKASTIAVDGTTQSRSLTAIDVDWMSFPAQKDSIYVISAARSGTGTLSSFYVYLYNTSGSSSLGYNYSTSPKIVWTCPSSGTYYLRVYSSSTSYYGDYSISVKKYSSAVSVTFTNPASQSVWSAGSSYSIQWISDTTLFGTYVRLQLNIDTTLVLNITSQTSNTGTYSWTPLAGLKSSNKYTIKLSSYNSTLIAGYSPAFTINGIDDDAFEPDDSVTTAHTIPTTGTPQSHTLPYVDQDWYSFTANVNYVYVIKTTGATRSMSTQLSLYATDGKTLTSSAYSTTSDSSATLVMYCSAAGNYFFRVTSSTYGGYLASVIAYDSTKFGLTVTSPAAGDSVAQGQIKTITWSGQISLGGNVDIFLYNSSGVVQTIVANITNSGTYSWSVPSTLTAGNDYYVKVISRVNSNIFGSSGVFIIK